jgi:hypothetical protein
MPVMMFIHPSNPDLFELYGIVVSVLLAAWILNSLYEWLKTKPWKKKEIPNADLFLDRSQIHRS